MGYGVRMWTRAVGLGRLRRKRTVADVVRYAITPSPPARRQTCGLGVAVLQGEYRTNHNRRGRVPPASACTLFKTVELHIPRPTFSFPTCLSSGTGLAAPPVCPPSSAVERVRTPRRVLGSHKAVPPPFPFLFRLFRSSLFAVWE